MSVESAETFIEDFNRPTLKGSHNIAFAQATKIITPSRRFMEVTSEPTLPAVIMSGGETIDYPAVTTAVTVAAVLMQDENGNDIYVTGGSFRPEGTTLPNRREAREVALDRATDHMDHRKFGGTNEGHLIGPKLGFKEKGVFTYLYLKALDRLRIQIEQRENIRGQLTIDGFVIRRNVE
jgi:hypothetical protein